MFFFLFIWSQYEVCFKLRSLNLKYYKMKSIKFSLIRIFNREVVDLYYHLLCYQSYVKWGKWGQWEIDVNADNAVVDSVVQHL